MKEITCSNCGQTMSDSYTQCPVCGKVIENQPEPVHSTGQKRFVIFFIVLTLFCMVLALLLPR